MRQGKARNTNQSLNWGEGWEFLSNSETVFPLLKREESWAGIRESRNTGTLILYILHCRIMRCWCIVTDLKIDLLSRFQVKKSPFAFYLCILHRGAALQGLNQSWWTLLIVCCRSCPVHCRVEAAYLDSTHWVLLAPPASLPELWQAALTPDIAQCPMGTESPLVENLCFESWLSPVAYTWSAE